MATPALDMSSVLAKAGLQDRLCQLRVSKQPCAPSSLPLTKRSCDTSDVVFPSVAVAAAPVPVTCVGRLKHASLCAASPQPPPCGPRVPAAGQDSCPHATASPAAGPPHQVALSNQECGAVPSSDSRALHSAVASAPHGRSQSRDRLLMGGGAGAGDPGGTVPGCWHWLAPPPAAVSSFLCALLCCPV